MATRTDCTVVGIIGSAGVGKTTAAQMLEDRHGFITFNFADELKITMHRWFDIPLNVMFGPSEAKDAKVRQMMQHLGTEFGRTFDSDIWVKLFDRRLRAYVATGIDPLGLVPAYINQLHPPRIAVGDIRFPNEAAYVSGLPRGCVIRITKEKPKTSPDMTEEQQMHTSETAQRLIPPEQIDYTVVNDGDLANLEEQLRTIIRAEENRYAR